MGPFLAGVFQHLCAHQAKTLILLTFVMGSEIALMVMMRQLHSVKVSHAPNFATLILLL